MGLNKSGRPNRQQIADHLGISYGKASHLAKAGMPNTSVEAAEIWCHENGVEIGRDRHKVKPPSDNPDVVSDEDVHVSDDAINSDDISGLLYRAKKVEMRCYKRVETLEGSMGYAKALAAYNQAAKARLEVEKAFNELSIAAQTMVPADTAAQVAKQILEIFLQQIQSFPEAWAQRTNPGNPAVALDALQTGIKQLMKTVKVQSAAQMKKFFRNRAEEIDAS